MKYLSNIFILFLIFAFVGCSGGEKQAAPQQKESSGESGGAQVATTQKVHIYGINKLKFVVAQKSNALKTSGSLTVNGKTYYELEGIKTRSGEELTVKLTTISNMPASAMSHNWLLLKQKADPAAFARASLQAKENNYVAPEKMHLVIAETGLVAPGNTTTITFTTPEEAGEYKYICTFPGHFAAGMRGTLYVN